MHARCVYGGCFTESANRQKRKVPTKLAPLLAKPAASGGDCSHLAPCTPELHSQAVQQEPNDNETSVLDHPREACDGTALHLLYPGVDP